MSYAKGYYSIIQYCPDQSRLEAVNIGVALLCPELRFVGAKFRSRKTKVSQLFGKQDWEFVELQQTAIVERLVREHEAFKTLEDFQAYISRRANALMMTSPRPVKVQDPSQDLESLLFRLVASPVARTSRAAPISKELESVLQDASVVSRLQRNVTVNPPSLPRPLKVPFAYRNGRLNLIQPVGFEGQTAEKVFGRPASRPLRVSSSATSRTRISGS